MWAVGGVDLPLPDEDVSAFGELVGAAIHTSAATGRMDHHRR
jgi:hypothetical protein